MKVNKPLHSLPGLCAAPGPEPTGPLAVCRVTRLITDKVNDNEDAEILCLEEDLKVLKVQGMENFKCYYFLHRAEVLVSVFQIKRSVKIRAF